MTLSATGDFKGSKPEVTTWCQRKSKLEEEAEEVIQTELERESETGDREQNDYSELQPEQRL